VASSDDVRVWRRGEQPPDYDEILNGIAKMVMGMDAKLDEVLSLLGDEDGEAEENA
jgi:hypothetical protein